MQPSSRRKLRKPNQADTSTLPDLLASVDYGKSTLIMEPSQLTIRWAMPAMQSLFQGTARTGVPGQLTQAGRTSGGAYVIPLEKGRRVT